MLLAMKVKFNDVFKTTWCEFGLCAMPLSLFSVELLSRCLQILGMFKILRKYGSFCLTWPVPVNVEHLCAVSNKMSTYCMLPCQD